MPLTIRAARITSGWAVDYLGDPAEVSGGSDLSIAGAALAPRRLSSRVTPAECRVRLRQIIAKPRGTDVY